MNIGTSYAVAVNGMSTSIVTVQGFVSSGLPYFSLVGSTDSVVSQARERVKAACKSTHFHWPSTRVTVNLSPASLPKYGSHFDLAIAVSIFAASKAINPNLLGHSVFAGELALDGSLLPTRGALAMAQCAAQNGLSDIYVPQANAEEAKIIRGITVHPVTHINQLLSILGAPPSLINEYYASQTAHAFTNIPSSSSAHTSQSQDDESAIYDNEENTSRDFSEIMGQEDAKFALLIAAAGNHHCLMTGSPGSGKSMLAKRLPSILPPLSTQESMEVARIRSVRGKKVTSPLPTLRPFVSVHHSTSVSAFAGGVNNGHIQPGALSLAHRGVLFLDEAPHFSRQTLQSLRTPLDDGCITVSRAQGHITYPARFMLILAQNPCPCGNLWNDFQHCDCTPYEKQRYAQKISQPLKDRIDIKLAVSPPEQTDASQQSNLDTYSPLLAGHMVWDSLHMRQLVSEARARSKSRYQGRLWNSNAYAHADWLMENTPQRFVKKLNSMVTTEEISMRGMHKILRLTWSCADIFGRSTPIDDDFSLAQELYLPS